MATLVSGLIVYLLAVSSFVLTTIALAPAKKLWATMIVRPFLAVVAVGQRHGQSMVDRFTRPAGQQVVFKIDPVNGCTVDPVIG